MTTATAIPKVAGIGAVIHYGPALSGWFQFRLDLALDHFRDTVAQFTAELQNELTDLDAHKPTLPTVAPPGP